MEKIGLIGCGVMGKAMAFNWLEDKYPLVVHDINPEPVQELVKKGATAANSPREVAEQVGIVIIMMPSSPQVEQVVDYHRLI